MNQRWKVYTFIIFFRSTFFSIGSTAKPFLAEKENGTNKDRIEDVVEAGKESFVAMKEKQKNESSMVPLPLTPLSPPPPNDDVSFKRQSWKYISKVKLIAFHFKANDVSLNNQHKFWKWNLLFLNKIRDRTKSVHGILFFFLRRIKDSNGLRSTWFTYRERKLVSSKSEKILRLEKLLLQRGYYTDMKNDSATKTFGTFATAHFPLGIQIWK